MDELISLFAKSTGEVPQCESIKGEGSNRKYYRLRSTHHSLVGVRGESLDENRAFIKLARHFEQKGLNTPRIVAVGHDEMYYLQEDLGSVSLFDEISASVAKHDFSGKDIRLLEKTMDKLADFQYKAAEDLDFSICYPLPEMDRQSILWDLNYFKYCFLKNAHMDFSEPLLEKDFQVFADDLMRYESDTFMYRDFQSRNVMVKDDDVYFIDFQGGRRGPIYYDVASFVWQAKADYSDSVKQKLIDAYIDSLRKYRAVDATDFRSVLNLFVLFRMVQVLGAYGYRGLFERKTHFIESIPFALSNVASLLQAHDFSRYPYLSSLLKSVSQDERFQKNKTKADEGLTVRIYSFSYKKGIPEDVSGNGGGYVFDCRAVNNPGRYDEYKCLTGLDEPVKRFLENDGEILTFLKSIYELADMHVGRYVERGFSSLMFSFGCTGGQHRSVYSAQHLAEHISEKFGVRVELCHREREVSQVFPSSK